MIDTITSCVIIALWYLLVLKGVWRPRAGENLRGSIWKYRFRSNIPRMIFRWNRGFKARPDDFKDFLNHRDEFFLFSFFEDI